MRLAKTAVENTFRAKTTDTSRHRDPERQLVAIAPRVAAPVDVLTVEHAVIADHQVALRPEETPTATSPTT